MLNFAIGVAKDAGRLLRDRVGTIIDIGHKGSINLVTDVDLASEKLIREAISTYYPRHEILAEEGGLSESSSEYRWIVDPLDGTTNYAHGYPVFCVSIGLEFQGEIVLGVVYDPMREELFTAERGAGATLNNRASLLSAAGAWLCRTGYPGAPHRRGSVPASQPGSRRSPVGAGALAPSSDAESASRQRCQPAASRAFRVRELGFGS